MKPSEKRLMYITIAAGVFFGAWNLGLDKVVDSFGAADSGIRTLEKRFSANLDALSDYYDIESRFATVGVRADAGDRARFTPALAFQQEVFDIANAEGFSAPNTLRAEMEDIDGVERYVLLSVAIRTEGDFARTVKLLKRFEQAGMIFREVELTTSRDSDKLTARITVARITDRPERAGRTVRRART
jgi:hypothetical protein